MASEFDAIVDDLRGIEAAYESRIAALEAEREALLRRIEDLQQPTPNPEPTGIAWKAPVLSVDGCLLFLTASNPDGSPVNFDLHDKFPVSCDLGFGTFEIPAENIAYDPRDFAALVCVIPAEHRQTVVTSASVEIAANGELPALDVDLKPEHILVEVFDYVEPEPLPEIQACLASGYPRFVGDLIFQDLSRQIGNTWADRLGKKGIAAEQTAVGLPTNFSGQLICNAISEMGDLPTGRMIMAWQGDTSVTILPHRSNGPNVIDDTIDGDWRVLTMEQADRWDTLWLITSDDCKGVTDFVVCYESDWDNAAKATRGFLTERFVSYAGRFTTLRPIKEMGTGGDVTFVTEDHITPASFRGYKQAIDVVANVVSVENFTGDLVYYQSHRDEGDCVLKITHDSPGAFATGDRLRSDMTQLPGSLDDRPLSHWKTTSQVIYVPDQAEPVLYLMLGDTDGSTLNYSGGGQIGMVRDFGWSPEQLAWTANGLHHAGNLQKLHTTMGHHETKERMLEYFRRLHQELAPTITLVLENSNEWSFNWNKPFAPQFWHSRFAGNLLGGSQWDWGAHRISEIYECASAYFPVERLEAGIFGQIGNRRSTEAMLDSAFLEAPIKVIGATNYFADPAVVRQLPEDALKSLTPDAWVTVMASCVQGSADQWQRHADLASERGLQCVSYEGGNHVTHRLDKYAQEVIFAHWMPRQALPFNLMFQNCKRLGIVPSFFQLISKTPVTARQTGQWVGVSTPSQKIGTGQDNASVIENWYAGLVDDNEFLRQIEAVKMNEVLKWCPTLEKENANA